MIESTGVGFSMVGEIAVKEVSLEPVKMGAENKA